MKYTALAALLLLSACATASAQSSQTATCRPAGYTRAQLDALAVAQDIPLHTLV